jgi:hypothetical protein
VSGTWEPHSDLHMYEDRVEIRLQVGLYHGTVQLSYGTQNIAARSVSPGEIHIYCFVSADIDITTVFLIIIQIQPSPQQSLLI